MIDDKFRSAAPFLTALLLLAPASIPAAAGPAPAAPDPSHREPPGVTTSSYESILYELGSFPVAKLTQPYWTNGNPGQVYSKGERIDVNGWLPPYWTAEGDYLTPEEKHRFGIPRPRLDFDRCEAILDVDTYQKTRDPLLYAAMRFTLENIFQQGIPVGRTDRIVQVYEARIGLEMQSLRALKGHLKSDEVMTLYGRRRDSELLDLFPAPAIGDKAYISFLEGLATDSQLHVYDRFQAYRLLDRTNKAPDHAALRSFILENVGTAEWWWHRCRMYDALVEIGDTASLAGINTALLNDPATECRQGIIDDLREHGIIREAVNSMLVLSQSGGQPHRNLTVNSGGPENWRHSLREYLTWAIVQPAVDAETQAKLKQALDHLKDH